MTGSASEFANTDEATEPLDTSISRPDTYAAHANESASRMQESIARHLEPGDTRATSRRLSDTPDSVRSLFHRESEGEEGGEESKSVLETVHEYVAKALGGGSRGAE
ncbi:transcriptional regulator family: GATA type zinc finger [Penicillium odoratum]|uniref:transcriptional regulator family: GATA type zinc finger n=1 Tax=Penicillium odoratum TaxID=1167516 RepID=UPI002548E72A|nr:transcriptional regulator family: GATA type zinc finger [Penicillium odoratum]KAJ5772485.1 transcriptional regulator family: GATA type zinc finger [Penicillium odoratum]